ncbi:MAG: PLP-dependent aminotransferase family protein [Deltaproteobacteria bacterium]|nr:PLP-dependent aminotransferase family protein [Deltaproteobacteria bacterium]
MSAWTLTLDLEGRDRDKGAQLPTFLRIARAISDDIVRGRLRAGDALPGSRSLAASLGVHRNTVLAAYRELGAEGWIACEEARGTFVSKQIPEVAPRRFASAAASPREIAARVGFDLGPARIGPVPPPAPLPVPRSSRLEGPMSLGGGVPDVRLVPAAEIARAMRRVLRRNLLEVLSYGDPAGPLALRTALADMVAHTRGVVARPENVLVTRGSQMGIDLVARTLVSAGDVIAIEALGYRPAWEALRAAGAHLAPIPVDAHGLDVDALERLAQDPRSKLRGVYVTPHHQFPTTVTLAPARRLRLLDLAREHRLFLLEDDYDHEFHYEGRPVQPLASADVNGVVVYVGTLSKVLAPGMRLGFVIAPAPLASRLVAMRRVVDRQGDQILEHAVADLLEEGEIQRHIRRAKRIYAERRERACGLLAKTFGEALAFEPPLGGTAIWARVSPEISVDAWSESAAKQGLVLQAARQFAVDGKPRPFLRIGFAQHDEREVREAVRRMHAAMPRAR